MHLAAFIEIASPQTPPSLFIALDALGETLAVPHRSVLFSLPLKNGHPRLKFFRGGVIAV